MAMGMECSFSIREYAARMRCVDVVKCWPFEEADDETIKTLLPPIAIKKFRWWFDELELVRSNCALYGKRSKKQLQEAGETSGLESENIESMRIKRVGKINPAKGKLKLKNRPPKKRSIVELFAASPQVERVNSDNEEDDDDHHSYNEEDSDNDSVQKGGHFNSKLFAVGNAGSKCKSKRKVKKKGTASMLEKQKKAVKSLKKEATKTRKMEKDTALLVRNVKKEKSSRLKLISSVGSVSSPKCSTNVTGTIGEIASHKKEARLKCLPSEKKSKTLKTSDLMGKNKQLGLPVRGILKNRKKICPVKKSTGSISQDAVKVNKCDTHVNKHVTFSVNDEVLGARRKKNSTVELESENVCNLSSDVTDAPRLNDHAAERAKGQIIHQMVDVEEEYDNYQENEINVKPVTGKPFSISSHGKDAPIFLTNHVSGQENFFDEPVSLGPVALLHDENLQSLEGCRRGKSHDALYTCSTLPMTQDDRIPKLTSPEFGHLSDASSSNGPFSGYFTDFLKVYPPPSASCKSILNENANCRLHFPPQLTQPNYCDYPSQYPWFPHLTPETLMRTICSFPDWKPRVSLCGETSINEDLVGLPLNSQGELIRLNPNISGRFDHLRDTSAILSPSTCSPMYNNVPSNFMFDQTYFRSWNGITSPADHLRMCRGEDFGREIDSFPISSRLDPVEQNYGARRTNIMPTGLEPSFCALESEMDLSKMLCNRSRQDLVQKHAGNPSNISLQFTQSTMRLMGKEFKIGGNELQAVEDREAWMDREAIKEQHNSSATEGPHIRSHDFPEFAAHPISTKFKNSVIHLSEAEVNPASGSVSRVILPESRIISQFLQSQDNIIHPDGYGTGKGNGIPENYPHFPLAASPLPGCGRTVCQEPLFCGYSSPTASQTLVPSSLFPNTRPSMSRNCIELKNLQKPPNPSNFAFNLPFPNEECGTHVQQSWTQNSFNAMTPWWLDSRQKGILNDYNQTYSSPTSSSHEWSISGIDHQTEPSVCPISEPFCVFPGAKLQNSLASSSLVPCPLLPLHPAGISPDSVSQNRYREKMKFENRMKSRDGIRIPNPGTRPKKRSASDDVVKLTKMPKLRIQGDTMDTVTALQTIPIFEPDFQCSREVLESSLAKHKANNMECSKVSAHKDRNKVWSAMTFNKLQGVPRSGPIKLTPGGKYQLRPCQNKEQINSKSSHSSIPFAEMTGDDSVLACEKSAKIYMF